MIVTVTPTVMDGTVVRWWASEDAELPIAVASQRGMRALPRAPEDVVAAAGAAAVQIIAGADVSRLATHVRKDGRLVAVPEVAE